MDKSESRRFAGGEGGDSLSAGRLLDVAPVPDFPEKPLDPVVLEISSSGCRIEGFEDHVAIGSTIVVTFPAMDGVIACVCWINGSQARLEFVEALPFEAVSRIAAQACAPVRLRASSHNVLENRGIRQADNGSCPESG